MFKTHKRGGIRFIRIGDVTATICIPRAVRREIALFSAATFALAPFVYLTVRAIALGTI